MLKYIWNKGKTFVQWYKDEHGHGVHHALRTYASVGPWRPSRSQAAGAILGRFLRQLQKVDLTMRAPRHGGWLCHGNGFGWFATWRLATVVIETGRLGWSHGRGLCHGDRCLRVEVWSTRVLTLHQTVLAPLPLYNRHHLQGNKDGANLSGLIAEDILKSRYTELCFRDKFLLQYHHLLTSPFRKQKMSATKKPWKDKIRYINTRQMMPRRFQWYYRLCIFASILAT